MYNERRSNQRHAGKCRFHGYTLFSVFGCQLETQYKQTRSLERTGVRRNNRRMETDKWRGMGKSIMTERKPRKHNKEWQDSTRTERSKQRRAQLRAILNAAGWQSESELLTSIINGDVEVPRKPE